MSNVEKRECIYYTSKVEPSPQNSKNFFEFSKETLTEAKITLNDVIDFARQEKRAKLNPEERLEKLNIEDDCVKSSTGVVQFQKDGHVGHIRWWGFYPSEGGNKPPIIAMHGGPAFNHKYMLPLKLLAFPEFRGYPVIFYDQSGCGGSTKITPLMDKNNKNNANDGDSVVSGETEKHTQNIPTHLFTVEYYVEEFLHLLYCWSTSKDYPICFQNGYYVYGSSWGTILAQEVAVHLREKMDQNQSDFKTNLGKLPMLLGLFLDGALSDAKLYCKSQWKYRISRMPSFTYHLLNKLEDLAAENGPEDTDIESRDKNLPPSSSTNWYQTKTYKEIERVLTSMFTTRLAPLPDFWEECLAGANFEIYAKMQGSSEFTIGGRLKNWSIVDRLPCLSKPTPLKEGDGVIVKAPLPVLALAGEFDTMTIECHENVLDSIGGQNNKLVVIPRAGHCKLVDEPLACCEEVLKFIH